MPTKHPRRSVTYTPDLQEAVANLERHGFRGTLGELLKLGAVTKLTELEQGNQAPDEETLKQRRRFLDLSGKPGLFDLDVAQSVREDGWDRS